MDLWQRLAPAPKSAHRIDMLRLPLFGKWLSVVAALIVWSFTFSVRGADTDVIINEIMYHPPLDLDELQYVELFNRGETAVDLSKWSLGKKIKFEFPNKTQLSPGGYLVICRNAKAFAANYGNEISVLGDFSGRLSHGGE